jgi:putative oxidoreductase
MGGGKGLENFFRDVIYGNKITFVIRFCIGVLFLFSGTTKLYDPDSFARVIARYDVLPDVLIGYAAVVVPALEVLVGLLLVIGFKVRAASSLFMLLMAVFILFISVNVIRGRSFDCGCFNAGLLGLEAYENTSLWLIIRDCIFLAACAVVFRADRHLCSIDNYREKIRLKHLEKTKYQ